MFKRLLEGPEAPEALERLASDCDRSVIFPYFFGNWNYLLTKYKETGGKILEEAILDSLTDWDSLMDCQGARKARRTRER